MKRLLILLALVVCQPSCFAAIYKCQQEGGKIEYQGTPCAHDATTTAKPIRIETPVAVASSAPGGEKQCTGKELRINFSDMPLRSTLQVLADFSGNKLVVDASIKSSGAFNYECVAWDVVLQDIASRHQLITRIENGTIFATRR